MAFGGETRRERNEKFGKSELSPQVELPVIGEYLFDWFFDISSGRSSGMSGFDPISSVEIESWSRMTGNELSFFDFKTIRAMDGSYRLQYSIEADAHSSRGNNG